MNRIDESEAEEIRGLMDSGFKAAWIKDLKVGDIFAGPVITRSEGPRKLFVVERILNLDGSYWGEDERMHENVVVNMIVTDEDGIERHLSYGHTHNVYIWRP